MPTYIDQRYRRQKPRKEPVGVYRGTMNRPLTANQAAILKHLREYFEQFGEAPGITATARRFKLSNSGLVTVYQALQRKGYLRMAGAQTRTLRLTEKGIMRPIPASTPE